MFKNFIKANIGKKLKFQCWTKDNLYYQVSKYKLEIYIFDYEEKNNKINIEVYTKTYASSYDPEFHNSEPDDVILNIEFENPNFTIDQFISKIYTKLKIPVTKFILD